jgi:hypothetical protein
VSAPKVDVLAWFDDYIRRCGAYDDGTPIRAAVAELIEAAKLATEEKYHDGASSREACDRLVAAIANIGPQS